MEKTFSRHEHPGRCDVCGKEGPVVLNKSIFGPFDFSYCEKCFRTGAEPYWFTVNTVALMGLWPDDIGEAFQMMRMPPRNDSRTDEVRHLDR